MPIYASNPERYHNAQPWPLVPCDFRCADGSYIPPAIYVDTDTGVVISHKNDEKGVLVQWTYDTYGGLVEVVKLFPAPLTCVPYDPNNHADKPIVV